MNLSKKIKFAALLAASLFVTGCGSQANIGYVDSGRLMEEAPQIKAVLEEGRQKAEEIQKEMQTALENNPDWSDEEKSKATADAQRKLMGINQAYATQLKYKLDEALAAISQEKKLDVVVDSSKNQPIVLQGGIDITEDTIKKLQ